MNTFARLTSPPSLLVAAFLLANAAVSAWATEGQTIRLQADLQIPNAVLSPGAYTFAIEDRLADRAIVRVTAGEGDQHYLLLAAPNGHLQPPGENGLVLFRSDAGGRQILSGWRCPACAAPLELAYPKAEAAKILGETGQSVLAVDSEYDKLPATLTADDLKVVTLWLLSPKRLTAGHQGQGIIAAKYVPTTQFDQGNAKSTVATAQVRMPKTATNTYALAAWGLLLITIAGFSWIWRCFGRRGEE